MIRLEAIHAYLLRNEKSRLFIPVFCLCITFFLMPLWGFHFYKYAGDTFFNLWFVRYYAENLQYIFFLPDCINTSDSSSLNPLPCFYANTLHWPAALLATVLPARGAVWLFLFFCTFIQSLLCAALFSKVTGSRYKGCLIAVLVIFSGYAMNNLYARGALAEYGATALSFGGLCALLAMIICPQRKREWLVIAAFLFSVAFNMHPITMMYSAIFFLPIVIWGAYAFFTKLEEKYDIVFVSVIFLIFIFSLSHFFYIYYKTNSILYINNYEIHTYVPGVDNLFLRIFVFPVCFLLFEPAPFFKTDLGLMSCQVNIPLLLAAAYAFVHRLRQKDPVSPPKSCIMPTVSLLAFMVAVYCIYISVKPSGSRWVDYIIITRGQFPYRLITYINALLVISLFFSLWRSAGPGIFSFRRLMQFCGLAVLGVIIYSAQLWIAYEARNEAIDRLWPTARQAYKSENADAVTGRNIYGFYDYATFLAYRFAEGEEGASREVRLTPVKGDPNALAGYGIDLAPGEAIIVNVTPFIWNNLYAIRQDTGERHRIPRDSLFLLPDRTGTLLIKDLPPGRYTLEARFEPPFAWRVLRIGFFLATVLLLVASIVAAMRIVARYGEAPGS